MTVEDQLRTEFAEILVTHRYVYGQWDGATICRCGQPADRVPPRNASADHRAHVASALASSPTVAALIDRVERAERERDEWNDRADEEHESGGKAFRELVTTLKETEAEWLKDSDALAALRAAVEGLADEWAPPGKDSYGVIESDNAADALRGLLTEGADDGQ